MSAPEYWVITDHVCRHCFGRVLRSAPRKGEPVVCRCADCGLSAAGGHREICCCGIKTWGKAAIAKTNRLRCERQEHPTPEFPAEITAVEVR